jgi:hypothetical protein
MLVQPSPSPDLALYLSTKKIIKPKMEENMFSKKLVLIVALVILSMATFGIAQQRSDSHVINFTIPNIYVLDVDNNGGTNSPGTDVGIALTDPANPGAQPTVAYTNNDNYLNYTSVVAASATHKISAKLDKTLPGINIRVSASAPAGGYGTMGSTYASNLVLSTTDQTVISGIGTCWTGTGGTDGAAVIYSIVFDDATAASLLAADPVHTVTYTISD